MSRASSKVKLLLSFSNEVHRTGFNFKLRRLVIRKVTPMHKIGEMIYTKILLMLNIPRRFIDSKL